MTRVDESEEESEDAGGQNTGGEEEVEETEEEEEEEVVSGNILAKRKNKPPRTSNDNSKEMPSMLASTVIQVTDSVLDPVVSSVGFDFRHLHWQVKLTHLCQLLNPI